MARPTRRRRSSPLRVLILSSIILPILFAFPSTVPLAHAQGGLLYVSPASQGPFAKDATLTYQVKVANMDPFDSWDISVQSDPSILHAVDFTVTGNLFEANFTTTVTEAAHCVDGVGTGCSISDTSGIVHSTAISNGGPGSGSGRLFTITYQVAGSGTSPVTIPPGFDFLANAGATVSHTTAGAAYGAPPTFGLTADPASLTFRLGSSAASLISLQSTGGFAGSVNVSAAVKPVTGAPSLSLSTATSTGSGVIVPLSAGGTGTATLNVASIISTVAGTYSVTVTGMSGSIQASVQITVNITDFSLSASPNSQTIRIGKSGTFLLSLNGLNGFTGDVILSAVSSCQVLGMDPHACLVPSVGPNTISLSMTMNSATSVLAVTIPNGTHQSTFGTHQFAYTVTVTGTSGSLVHTVTVTVIAVHPAAPSRFGATTNSIVATVIND